MAGIGYCRRSSTPCRTPPGGHSTRRASKIVRAALFPPPPPPGQHPRFVDNAVLYKPTKPDPLISDTTDRELIAMMQGVVERGTGTAVAAVGKPLAGKTGTTSA